jgi:hypothetical protein
MTETLLDKAKANTSRKVPKMKKGTSEQVEMALEWARENVSLSASAAAVGHGSNQSYRTYSILARSLATYIQKLGL